MLIEHATLQIRGNLKITIAVPLRLNEECLPMVYTIKLVSGVPRWSVDDFLILFHIVIPTQAILNTFFVISSKLKIRRKKITDFKKLTLFIFFIKVFISWNNVRFTTEYHFYRLAILYRIIILYSYTIVIETITIQFHIKIVSLF